MPGSRSVVLLALASVLVLMLGAAAWCGGPVTPRAPGFGQQPGMPPGVGGDAGPGNLQVSGSIGSASVNGSNGKSPWVNFSEVGINSAVAWGAGARFEPRMFGVDLGINADILYTHFTGSESNITGVPGSLVLLPSTSVDATFNLTVLSVTGDLGLTTSFLGPCSAIRIGPKLGWIQYIDRFRVENNTTGRDGSSNRSIAMFTAGLVGRVDLLALSGAGMPFTTPYGSVRPILSAEASLAGGDDMRLYKWEVFLKIFQTARDNALLSYVGTLPVAPPTLAVEIGWVRYDFDQTYHEEGFVAGIGAIRDSNANYRIDIPTIKAVATF